MGAYKNIFLNILTALCRVYIIIPINVGLRITRGYIWHLPDITAQYFVCVTLIQAYLNNCHDLNLFFLNRNYVFFESVPILNVILVKQS